MSETEYITSRGWGPGTRNRWRDPLEVEAQCSLSAAVMIQRCRDAKELNRADARIAELETQVSDLARQRDAALADADRLRGVAQTANGLFQERSFEAADLRQQLATLTAERESFESQLTAFHHWVIGLGKHASTASTAMRQIEQRLEEHAAFESRFASVADAARTMIQNADAAIDAVVYEPVVEYFKGQKRAAEHILEIFAIAQEAQGNG